MMGQIFWEARSIYAAKIDLKTPPRLIYQEIVPFQSEYEHGVIIWSFPLLNGFNGSIFLSELFGCLCFTNVCVVSFQTIWFFKWFWQQIHLCCYVWSHFQHMPEYVFTTKKMEFFRCLHDPAGWVQGKWSYHSNLILNKLSVCSFYFVFSLTVKIILKIIVALG